MSLSIKGLEILMFFDSKYLHDFVKLIDYDFHENLQIITTFIEGIENRLY